MKIIFTTTSVQQVRVKLLSATPSQMLVRDVHYAPRNVLWELLPEQLKKNTLSIKKNASSAASVLKPASLVQ